VTGGSSGIGQGIVHYLTKAGVKVLIGDLQEPTEPIDGPIFHKTDAGSWDDLLALFKKAEELFGRIDIVVPNAGFGDRGDYFDHKDDNGDPIKPEFSCLKVTLIGQMYTVKLAMHFMRKQKPQGGVVVSTVSRSGYDCQSIPVYAVSKHGMIGLMRGLRNHTPHWNIRVNSIAPHVTDTAAVRRLPSLVPDLQRVGIPVSTVEETARAAAFLAANEDYNGCTISIMGSEYRELESGVERHKVDVMGDDPRFRMNAEQQEIMGESTSFGSNDKADKDETISFRQHRNGDSASNAGDRDALPLERHCSLRLPVTVSTIEKVHSPINATVISFRL
jgi:NAD(P)-dependent dehydrogenase (short-subunit alcohol dehydrogenase family)